MIKLTVAIITYNEENNIARCIGSVKDIADEILVVDSFSTDRTKEICLELGARFIEQKFLGYQDQKNLALNLSTYDHVLSLDADEALSPELNNEIKKVKSNFISSGYSFNRLTNYCGHWVRHCGWYPDNKIRLVNKHHAKWVGGNIHEHLEVDGLVSQLPGDLYHYSFETIASHIIQTNKFSTASAEIYFAKGKRSSIALIITRPLFQFFRDYFIKLGFLDGRYGFIICFINSVSAMLKYAKLFDLQLGRKI